MAQEERNRLAEWYLLIREQAPVVRHRVELWWGAVREEPGLIWQAPTVRYVAYLVGGLLAVWLVTGAVNLAVPPVPTAARPVATKGDFHVICSDESCGRHFAIHREFGFRRFPVICPQCTKQTGMAARRCNSKSCNGRWVVPVHASDRTACPACGYVFE